MKHAVIETGGKQYRVAEGDVIYVEKLDAEAGATVKFDRVLAVIGEDNAVFGTPVVEGATVTANVVKRARQEGPRLQDEAQEGLSAHAGPSPALHEGPDRDHRVTQSRTYDIGGVTHGT